MNTFFCPVCNRQITVDECFDISMFAEETTPERFLPDDIKPEQARERADICMKCEYHPE